MTEHTHVIVWIDHHQARVFHFNATDEQRIVVHPEHPVKHIHHKANSSGSGHAAEDPHFFRDVVEAIGHPLKIFITGPSNEKTELMKYIENHAHALKSAITGVESSDYPTDGELVTHARKYFGADHLSQPRMT